MEKGGVTLAEKWLAGLHSPDESERYQSLAELNRAGHYGKAEELARLYSRLQ